jgi:site-specific DNA recombinase
MRRPHLTIVGSAPGGSAPVWMGRNNLALGIVRVSTKRQKDNTSPGTQRDGINAYAASKGLKLVDVIEVDESASDPRKRRKFHAAIQRAKTEGIRHLVLWVWDRTTRNMTDHEVLEVEILDDVFVLHTAHDGRVLHADSPDSDWSAAESDTISAKRYSRELRRRAADAARSKAENGWYPGSHPSLGYVNKKDVGPDGQVKDRGCTIAITPWCRPLMRRMRELRLQGKTFKAVGNAVVAEGLVPERHVRSFLASHGGVANVERLLKHPFYVGRFEWDGVMYQGKHEPVFTEREWDELQAFGRRGSQHVRKHDGLFTASDMRLRCAEPGCGCLVTYSPIIKKNGKRYDYYHCANGKNVHAVEVNVTQDSIMAQLSAVPDAIHLTEDVADAISKILNETHHRAQRAKDKEADEYRSQLAQLDQKENRLCDLLADGTLDAETFKGQQMRLRGERDRLFELLQDAQRQIDGAYLVLADKVLNVAKNAKRLWESRSPEERRDFLAKLLLNPVLDGTTVRFDLRRPYRVLAEMHGNEEWRARLVPI